MGLSPKLEATLREHDRRAEPVIARIRTYFEQNRNAYRLALPLDDLAKDPELNRSTIISLFHAAVAVRKSGLVQRLFAKPPIPDYGGMPAGSRTVEVLKSLSRRRPAYTRDEATLLLELLDDVLDGHNAQDEWLLISLVGQPLAAAERAVKEGGLGELGGSISRVAEHLGKFAQYSLGDASKARARYLALLGGDGEGVQTRADLVVPGETWGEKWGPRIRELDPMLQALIVYLPLASSVVPTAAWRKRAAELLAPGAGGVLREMLQDAMASRTTRPARSVTYGEQTFVYGEPAIASPNALVLRGAIWAAAALDEAWVAPLLGELGVYFGTSGTSSNVAREGRLASSAANALGAIGSVDAIAGLGRMKAKVTNRPVAKQVVKALDGAARKAGVTPGELLELAVPTAGLGSDGTREVRVDAWAANLSIDGDDAKLVWRGPDGTETSKAPAALVESDKAAVERLKADLRDLRKTLAIERGRVEELLVEDRDWPLDTWRTRYLNHPLTRSIATGLIWRFSTGAPGETTTAMPLPGGFRTATGGLVDPAVNARVRLWHAIDATDDEVVEWRRFLMEHQYRQPFKQAFREVYAATAAEDHTSLYSNRFAGHILRYGQARALMTVRRWASNFLGPFDGGDTGVAKRDFPSHNIRAEFWHDAIMNDGHADIGWENCTTDQVRFLRLGRDQTVIPIREVPPRVFSEAMRDVDLIVSVTSVGADRNWQDAGLNRAGRFDTYWNAYSTAELSGSAVVRRAVLADLIPGLAIAERLELSDRWLHVRGDRRRYRIHIGSGNILMEPKDEYLCIVPSRKRSDDVFLPFDDDPTLSVILSKAFMLAADTKIIDPTIVSQIR